MNQREAIRAGHRWCYYVADDSADETGRFVPSCVVEGIAGHCPMSGNGEGASPWYWGDTLTQARETCERVNAQRGITPDIADEIVLSSMMASYGKAGAA